jgi:hypothetical protein
MNDRADKPWWRLPFWFVVAGFLAVAGFFLVTEHSADLYGVLPFLPLLACSLMHFFHHGHGGHRKRSR